MKARILALVLLHFWPASATAQEAPPTESAVLEKDFERMMDWFAGRFDNQEQVYFEEELGVPEAERHERIHSIFYPAELKAIPGRTFYVQQYTDGDPAKIYRQRIYSFSVEAQRGAIRLDILTPKHPERLTDAHLDPEKLKGLRRGDLEARPGCEVWWHPQANQFIGEMDDGACSFVSERSGKRIFIDDDLILTADEIWIADRATDADGAPVFGHPKGVPHKSRRARPFTCWAAIPKADGGWHFEPEIALHDQGGMVWIAADETVASRFGLKMRNVVWPYGEREPSLVLYVYKPEETAAISYAWAPPDASRVGLNLRTMQASCRLDTDDWTMRP